MPHSELQDDAKGLEMHPPRNCQLGSSAPSRIPTFVKISWIYSSSKPSASVAEIRSDGRNRINP